MKILIADDEEQFLEPLRSALAQAGYEVISATDGVEALSQVRAEMPDLILLDAMMPRMDGFEVLTRVKADPVTAGIPVVLLIGMPAEAREYPAISKPGEFILSDYLALIVIKPLLKDLSQLVEALAELKPNR